MRMTKETGGGCIMMYEGSSWFQASFNKLQKMLCDKWDFILMQAEEQVR